MSVTMARNDLRMYGETLTLLNPLSWWEDGIKDVLLLGLVFHGWQSAFPL